VAIAAAASRRSSQHYGGRHDTIDRRGKLVARDWSTSMATLRAARLAQRSP